MKRSFLLVVSTALCFALSPSAVADFVSFASLLPPQSGPTLYPNLPTVTLSTASGTPLVLGVRALDGVNTSQQVGKVSSIFVLAAKTQWTPEELTAMQQWIGSAATRCFNISPERLNALNAWLTRQNLTLARTPQRASFGPLELSYHQWQYSTAQSVASLVLNRAGTPGEEPWSNGCTLP